MSDEAAQPRRKPNIYVDADACPVKDILERAALRVGFPIWFVSNRPVGIKGKVGVFVVMAPAGMDEADRLITERAEAGDLVVTADLPLAADTLAKGARVIDFRGGMFDPKTIESKLRVREMNEIMRGGFEFTGGPAPMKTQDRQKFAQALDRVLQQMSRA